MPVVDDTGHVVGLLHLHEALASVSVQLVSLIDRLTHADTVEGLTDVKAAQIDVAHALFAKRQPWMRTSTII